MKTQIVQTNNIIFFPFSSRNFSRGHNEKIHLKALEFSKSVDDKVINKKKVKLY